MDKHVFRLGSFQTFQYRQFPCFAAFYSQNALDIGGVVADDDYSFYSVYIPECVNGTGKNGILADFFGEFVEAHSDRVAVGGDYYVEHSAQYFV